MDFQTEKNYCQEWLYTAVLQTPTQEYMPMLCSEIYAIKLLPWSKLTKLLQKLFRPTAQTILYEGPFGHFQMLPTMPYNLLCVAFHWCQCASKFGSSFGAAEATPKQRTVRKNEGFMFQKPKKEKEINKYLMRPILKQKKLTSEMLQPL